MTLLSIEVRGLGGSDHLFLYRNRALRKDLAYNRIKASGQRVGVPVSPHRLRHTCATQLLNAGCPATSIQKLLGHQRLNSTMVYARVHDHTMAQDYYAAMEQVEQRLDLEPIPADHKADTAEPVTPLNAAICWPWFIS